MAEFINVYNFVPFPDKKAVAYEDTDQHTGVITYTIRTRTPLFIPNSSNEDAFKVPCAVEKSKEKHRSYDFYSYREMSEDKDYTDDPAEPVIPGSELRGMVRSIYETITDSCVGVLNEGTMPVMRTGAMFRPGLLVKTGEKRYKLEQAYSCTHRVNDAPQGKTFLSKKYVEGQKVHITVGPKRNGYYVKECQTGYVEDGYVGYYLKGMPDGGFNKKKDARVFVRKKDIDESKGFYDKWDKDIAITEEDILRLKAVIRSYQDQPGAPEGNYREYQEKLEKFLQGKGDKFPVYYLNEGNGRLVYLSPACMTKEMSHHSIGSLAKGMTLCTKVDEYCPACDLFGRIGVTNEDARASKIRFTDAEVAEASKRADVKEYYTGKVTLPTLAEPKLGAAEFYLKKPAENALFWTYDYYIEANDPKNRVVVSPAMLRGRKYYWHQPDMKLPVNVEATNLNKTVRPVEAGVVFTGKVYFDKISKKQLDQLIWILNGKEAGIELSYKLGGGKPFGLGSVECRVESLTERTISLDGGSISYVEHTMKTDEIVSYAYSHEALKFSQSSKAAFLRMSDYRAVEKMADGKKIIVSYPITEAQLKEKEAEGQGAAVKEGFKWFTENHKPTIKPRGYMVKATLPDATEASPLLPSYRTPAPGAKNNNFKGNNSKGNGYKGNGYKGGKGKGKNDWK